MRANRLISAFSAAFWLLSQMSPAFAQIYIEDSAYTKAVDALTDAGVLDPAFDVRLSAGVNRAEALKIILKSLPEHSARIDEMRSSMPSLPLFPDVKQNEWFAPYTELGFRAGLVKGYPDGLFRPERGVKVSEAVAMVARANADPMASISFRTSPDLPNERDQWFTPSINLILARNAVMPGSRLSPSGFMTRGQLIDMVYRMREAKARGLSSYTPPGSGPASSIPPGSPSSGTVVASDSHANALEFASEKPFAISIPSLSMMDLSVRHPEDALSQKSILAVLQEGVGHLFSFPGLGGKVMIYGHSSSWPWDLSKYTKIFRDINKIEIGAFVYVTYEGKLFVYQVTAKETIPVGDSTPFDPDENGEELILYTCWPPDTVNERFIVYAKPVKTVTLK